MATIKHVNLSLDDVNSILSTSYFIYLLVNVVYH